ncbi:MAG: acetyl-CoA decarbonylase/synthase complex subunit gamma [Deltaproteobacteria bacterium]|nr:acetyl-CoA decarbonylase/synthase complex subunit gamma [Deltaproteobacteria bacterium]
MGLSGIQIFKLLPKTNCGDCGVPTCLAFAMNLAAGKAELSQCPHVSEEAKAQLSEQSAPPIRTVTLGTGENEVKIGGETVMYRHEKTFYNKTGIGVMVADNEPAEKIEAKINNFKKLQYERVGLTLRPEIVTVKAAGGDFSGLVKKVVDETDAALVLMGDPDALKAGIEVSASRRPALYAATKENADAMAALAKEKGLPLVVKGNGLDETSELADKLAAGGLKDIILDIGTRKIGTLHKELVAARRLAIEKAYRPIGFPIITFPCEMSDDPIYEAALAGTLIAKYGSMIILSDLKPETLFPLLLERLNIYTDPQRPMKTDQGIYPINDPGPESPVLITCNFSLTYFVVSGEIEASRVPTWLLVQDTDGLSVLTGWAAGKFVGDLVGAFVKKSGIEEKVSKKRLILPGYVAVITGDVEEEVGSDWEVMVGPREGGHIVPYLKENFG